MIAIPDAGEIKAKVVVEYDGSGVEQAKKDLSSLADAAGSVGEGSGSASEGLNALDEQAGKAASSAHDLNSAFADLPKIAEKSGSAFTAFGESVAESRGAIDDMVASVEDVQTPLEKTSSLLEKAASPMSIISEHVQSMNDGFMQMGESLTQASPLLMQYGDTIQAQRQALHDAVGPFSASDFMQSQAGLGIEMFGAPLAEATTNVQAFQSAVEDPRFVAATDATHQALGGMSSDVQSVGKTLNESTASTQAFTDQFGAMNVAAADANKTMSGFASNINSFGGIGSAQYSPLTALEAAAGKPIGFGEALSNGMGGVMGALNDIAMPIMAVQMIGMAVGQVGKGIYDMAAVAEGPGAHGIGTFTGTVDALGQTVAQVGQQFSEGFGQAVLPTLQQMNYQMSQDSGSGGLGGSLGLGASFLFNVGRITSGLDVYGGAEGLRNMYDSMTGQPLTYQGPPPAQKAQTYTTQQMGAIPENVMMQTAQAQVQASQIFADVSNPAYLQAQDQLSAAQRYASHIQANYNSQHPISYAQFAQQQQMDSLTRRTQDAMGSYVSYADAGDYGGAFAPVSDFFNSMLHPGSTVAAGGGPTVHPSSPGLDSIGGFLSNTFSGGSAPSSILNGLLGGAAFGGNLGAIGNIFGGIGQFLGNAFAFAGPGAGLIGGTSMYPTNPISAMQGALGGIGGIFSDLFGGGGGGQTSVGCFPAGTRVLLPDGSERAIETLRVGEQVLAHDGTQHVTTTIVARIVPPPKKVYALSFDDGTTLTLTDSHPISTEKGWRSLHPRATREENPDLAVSTLCIGDTIHTANGTVKLVGILPCEVVQIYNLTVDEPHTFYANKILVHNKVLGGSMGANGTGDQQVSLSHTFTANITWEAQNLNKSFTAIAQWAEQGVQHAVTAIAHWAEEGVQHAVTAVAQWVEENVMHAVTAMAQWAEEGVMHAVTAVAQWAEQGVQHAVTAVANWAEQDVIHPVVAAAQWAERDLEHLFTGVASWIGQGLEHTFSAVANWTAQNLTPSFTVNPSVTMLAEGTSNFSGGPAIVGEAGTEVVGVNGQYSLFNQGASLVNLPAGASVYPMKDLNTSSPAQFANGTGGDTTPISLNMGGNSAPQSFNISLHVNDQAILSAFGVPLVQNVRLYSGQRGY